jgi:hypothetical protein
MSFGAAIVPWRPHFLRQAMPRYKDRTDPKQIEKIERTFPHIIEIIVPLGGFGKS